VRAVIDDRNTLLGEVFYKEYFRSQKSISGFKEFLERVKATHVVTGKDTQTYLLAKEVLGLNEINSDGPAHLFTVR